MTNLVPQTNGIMPSQEPPGEDDMPTIITWTDTSTGATARADGKVIGRIRKAAGDQYHAALQDPAAPALPDAFASAELAKTALEDLYRSLQPKRRGRPPGTTKPAEERKSEMIHFRATPVQRKAYEWLGGNEWASRELEKAVKRMRRDGLLP